MTTVIVLCVAVPLVALLVVWISHRTLIGAAGKGSGGGNAFGGFDVFDPGRARGNEEIKDHDERTVLAPTPSDDDRPRILVTDRFGNPTSIRLDRPRTRPQPDSQSDPQSGPHPPPPESPDA